jgi:hypothetical protein
MGILGWLGGHGFDLLQTTSVVVGLFATVHTIRADTNERRIENLFALTSAHRELWMKLYDKPTLARVLSDEVNLRREPPSLEEELFVHLLILNLRASFKARLAGMEFDDDAVAADIRQFFAHPIPREMWEKSKVYQDPEFISFVERSLKS